jgi:hypothetical protein
MGSAGTGATVPSVPHSCIIGKVTEKTDALTSPIQSQDRDCKNVPESHILFNDWIL